jgi:RNA polymerase sigma-70 factor (ECF subfamily)
MPAFETSVRVISTDMNALRDLSSQTLLMNTPNSPGEYSAPMPERMAPAALSFEEVVERYHGKVFQLVYRYTGDYEEACDLTQDAFVRAYGAWGEFRGESQIYTWLYRIALNLCHNNRKKGDRRRRVEGHSLDIAQNDDNETRPVEVADARPQPSHRIENDELRLRLHDALLELPDNYRTVIVLRDIEGLSYEEIAAVTDSTLEAIKSRLFRARTLLREILSPYLFGSGETSPKSSSAKSSSRRPGWKFGKNR